ncbi:hypothetical protein EJ110_NYTH38149 [Nymphaea thermarum]|nr:hypothetical protein EJ110_NYTH38149 [Nymphaea thermarum]
MPLVGSTLELSARPSAVLDGAKIRHGLFVYFKRLMSRIIACEPNKFLAITIFKVRSSLGKTSLWGLVDGSKSEPQLVLTKTIDGKAQELDGVEKDKAMNEYDRKWEEWKIGHHKIITWIIACVDTTTLGQIAKHNFAHEAWEFLKKTHTMKDVAYMCNLQMKIASLQQEDKSIKEYVGEMEQLWDELALFEPEWYDPRDIGVR